MSNIAIFASGSGTNAERIVTYFAGRDDIRIRIILCNAPKAYVLERARKLHVPSRVFTREELYHSRTVLDILKQNQIDWIILAGFLWKIPEDMLEAYPKRIINIHPALLPAYGGKGMYGHHVHQAVIDHHEPESGITIHYVDDQYDHGSIIFQATCPVMADDTPEQLAARIHELEYAYFPKVIAQVIDEESAQK